MGAHSYQELASDQDNDAAIIVGGLGIKSGNLVLDLLEGKSLHANFLFSDPYINLFVLLEGRACVAYSELRGDVGGSQR